MMNNNFYPRQNASDTSGSKGSRNVHMMKFLTFFMIAFVGLSGNVWGQFSGGSGTEADPYKISSDTDLRTLATNVNGGTTYSGVYFVVTADIDGLSSSIGHLGTETRTFKGVFDGGGHTITMNVSNGDPGCGLFGSIEGATIKNVIVDGSISGRGNKVAGIAGQAIGGSRIEKCVNKAKVVGTTEVAGIAGYISSTTITGCTNEADIELADANDIAGIVSAAYASADPQSTILENCVNNGSIKGKGKVAGIVSEIMAINDNSVTCVGCVNNGTITGVYYYYAGGVGGIVGRAEIYTYPGETISINKCTNSATVSGEVVGVGGIVGYLGGASGHRVSIKQCTNNKAITSNTKQVGGIAGYAKYTDIDECSNVGSVTGTEEIGGIVGAIDVNTIINSYNRGEVKGTKKLGGVVGVIRSYNSSVANCYNTGKVTRTSGEGNALGGIVGQNNEQPSAVYNCYSGNKITTTSEYKAGIVGEHYGGSIDHCYYRSGDGVSIVCFNSGGTDTNTATFSHTDGQTTCTLSSSIYSTTVLLDALNAWVAAQGSGSPYLSWIADTQNENRGMPIFYKCKPLTKPTVTITEQGDRYVKLSWGTVTGASSYNLFYGLNDPNDGLDEVWKVSGVTSPYKVERLTNGQTYKFAIMPVGTGDNCKDNPLSITKNGKPKCE